jgi:choice-of-anchor C domain-containing protein
MRYLILLALFSRALIAADFQNGSFELGTNPNRNLPAGSTAITGWVVLPDNIDWVQGVGGPASPTASDGVLFIDLNGCCHGTGGIQQTFDTVVGTTYTVTFDLNSNNDPAWGPLFPKPVEVSAAGVSQVFTYIPTALVGPWQTHTFTFAASSSQTTLRFNSLVASSAIGPLLDNVRVTGGDACPVSVTSVRMMSANTLRVQLRGTFSAAPIGPKALAMSTTIGARPLSGLTTLEVTASGEQLHSFLFDLRNEGVPRFSDNVRFRITPIWSEAGKECAGTDVGALILLPTILVPGILTGSGGDGTFPILEASLRSSTVLGDTLGEAYRLESDASFYPTLFTLSYRTSSAPIREGALDLDRLVARVKSITYADQVNVVGHSKGGLVGRWYATAGTPFSMGSSPTLKRLIMCVSPHLGSLEAAWEEILPGGRFNNLLPVWPWFRPVAERSGVPVEFIVRERNTELESLNDVQLPPGVTYSIFYSTGNDAGPIPTKITRTGNPQNFVFTYAAGDGIVPAFSQLGLLYNPNDPNAPLRSIRAFENIAINLENISGSHGGYLERPSVMAALLRHLLD